MKDSEAKIIKVQLKNIYVAIDLIEQVLENTKNR